MSVKGPIERFDNMGDRVIGIANDTSWERRHIDSETVHRKEIHDRDDATKGKDVSFEGVSSKGVPLNISMMIVALLALFAPIIGPIFAAILTPLHPTARKVARAIVIIEVVAMVAITIFGIALIE